MRKSIHTSQYAVLLELLVRVTAGANLTQEQLAARLDVTQSAVSKGERGERRLDVVELHDWCQALGHPFVTFTAEFDRRITAMP